MTFWEAFGRFMAVLGLFTLACVTLPTRDEETWAAVGRCGVVLLLFILLLFTCGLDPREVQAWISTL